MTAANVTSSREKFGGEMSEGELLFCRQLRECIHKVIEGHGLLDGLLKDVLCDLQVIRKWGLDVDSAYDSGWRPTIEIMRRARESLLPLTLPSAQERAVLEDMDGLVDYASRNGVSFDTLFAALAHDVGQIRSYEWNLAEAEKDALFHLRVTGWARRNAMPFGDPGVEPE